MYVWHKIPTHFVMLCVCTAGKNGEFRKSHSREILQSGGEMLLGGTFLQWWEIIGRL